MVAAEDPIRMMDKEGFSMGQEYRLWIEVDKYMEAMNKVQVIPL